MTPEMWMTMGLGVFLGYFVGRARAEWGRAMYDGRRARDGRDGYRY